MRHSVTQSARRRPRRAPGLGFSDGDGRSASRLGRWEAASSVPVSAIVETGPGRTDQGSVWSEPDSLAYSAWRRSWP